VVVPAALKFYEERRNFKVEYVEVSSNGVIKAVKIP
jgi:cysteine sulfinate desulfinase/cysteine desulfurase-like protein